MKYQFNNEKESLKILEPFELSEQLIIDLDKLYAKWKNKYNDKQKEMIDYNFRAVQRFTKLCVGIMIKDSIRADGEELGDSWWRGRLRYPLTLDVPDYVVKEGVYICAHIIFISNYLLAPFNTGKWVIWFDHIVNDESQEEYARPVFERAQKRFEDEVYQVVNDLVRKIVMVIFSWTKLNRSLFGVEPEKKSAGRSSSLDDELKRIYGKTVNVNDLMSMFK